MNNVKDGGFLDGRCCRPSPPGESTPRDLGASHVPGMGRRRESQLWQ
jgi:hypothetical protein